MRIERYEMNVTDLWLGGRLEVERDDDYGDWCRSEDVAQLEARIEALIRERDEAEQVALELPPMADFEDYVPEDWFKRQAALSERRAARIDAALGEQGGSDE